MADTDIETTIYKVSLLRRLAYPGVAAACAGLAVYNRGLGAGGEFPNIFYIVAAGSALLFLYINSIRLEITAKDVTLRWPLAVAKTIKWDDVVQIRRSAGPPGRGFFLDLIASPDHSVQFNPFMFDSPWEIIEKLNKYLDSDLFKEDQLPEMPGEVIVAAESDNGLGSNWVLWGMALIVVILLFALLLLR